MIPLILTINYYICISERVMTTGELTRRAVLEHLLVEFNHLCTLKSEYMHFNKTVLSRKMVELMQLHHT